MSQKEDAKKTVRDAISRNVAFDFGSRIGYLATRFFIPPYVLSHIGLDAYGLWAAAFVLVSYLGMSTLGVNAVYVKFVAEHGAKGEHARANSILSTGLVICVGMSSLLFGVVYFSWPHISTWIDIPEHLTEDARIAVLSVVGVFLADISLSVFPAALNGSQRLFAVKLIWVLSYAVEWVLIVILVGGGRGVRGLAEAFLARTAISIVFSAIVAYRSLPWLKLSARLFSWQSLKTIVTFGGTVQILSIFAIILFSIERAIAVPLVGLQAAGLIDIGKKLPGMAIIIPNSFAASFLSAASYLNGGLDGSDEEKATLSKLYLKGSRYMNLCSGMVNAFLAVFASWLLWVWLGQEYPGAALILCLFALSGQMHLLTGPGTEVLKGVGRPMEEFRYCLPCAIFVAINLPLSRFIEGEWTTRGIAISVVAATFLSAPIFIRRANKLLGVETKQYMKRVILPGLAPYPVGALIAYLTSFGLEGAGRWESAAWILGAGAIYSALCLVVIVRFVFDEGERLWFFAILKNALAKLKRGKAQPEPQPEAELTEQS